MSFIHSIRWNPFAVSSLLAGIASSALGFLVLLKSENRRLGKIWCLFGLSVAMYGFGGVGFSTALDPQRAFFWWHIAYGFGVIWIAPLFYHFVCEFVDSPRHWTRLHYVIGFFWLLLLPSRLFFDQVRWLFNSFFYAHVGLLYPLFFVWWLGLVFYGHYLLVRSLENVSIKKRDQIVYFLAATAFGFGGGCLSFLPDFGIDVYPWGNFTIFLYPVIMSYAILKHQLLDVKVVVRKTLVYSIVSASLIAVYVAMLTFITHLLEGHVMSPSIYSSTIAAGVIALLFHPLQMHFQRWIDRHFPREHLDAALLQEAAGGFAHEMKRPLAKISLPAELALMDLEGVETGERNFQEVLPTLKQRLKLIISQSVDAGNMIEAIRSLFVSTKVPFAAVDLREALRNALAAQKDLLEKLNISIHTAWPETLPFVSGRTKQLEIVFANLIKNAVDAMRDLPREQLREIKIEARVDANRVVIHVKDSGPGIQPEDIGRVFQPSYSTKGAHGTGMGLYLSRQIVEAHNGSIEIVSKNGSGAEFILSLPVAT